MSAPRNRPARQWPSQRASSDAMLPTATPRKHEPLGAELETKHHLLFRQPGNTILSLRVLLLCRPAIGWTVYRHCIGEEAPANDQLPSGHRCRLFTLTDHEQHSQARRARIERLVLPRALPGHSANEMWLRTFRSHKHGPPARAPGLLASKGIKRPTGPRPQSTSSSLNGTRDPHCCDARLR